MNDNNEVVMLTREQVMKRAASTMAKIGYGGKQSLARAAGIPQQNITEIFRGNRPPSPKFLTALGLRAVTLYVVVGEPATLDKPVFNRPKNKTLLTTSVVRPRNKSFRVIRKLME